MRNYIRTQAYTTPDIAHDSTSIHVHKHIHIHIALSATSVMIGSQWKTVHIAQGLSQSRSIFATQHSGAPLRLSRSLFSFVESLAWIIPFISPSQRNPSPGTHPGTVVVDLSFLTTDGRNAGRGVGTGRNYRRQNPFFFVCFEVTQC